jgi:hypothetical protein
MGDIDPFHLDGRGKTEDMPVHSRLPGRRAMRTLMILALALSAFSFAALAYGPASLTDKQMDTVRAGQQLLVPAPAAEPNPVPTIMTAPGDPGSDSFLEFIQVQPEGLGRGVEARIEHNTPSNP